MHFWQRDSIYLAYVFAFLIVSDTLVLSELHSFHSTKSILMESEVTAETTESGGAQWDCTTDAGGPGICKELHECYPLLFSRDNFQDYEGREEGPFYEDATNNLKSEMCSDSIPRACCGTNETSGDIIGMFHTLIEDDSIIIQQDHKASFRKPPVPIVRASDWESCGNSLEHARAQTSDTEDKGVKITGGKFARAGQFPWMVSIFGKNNKHTCGGSLLNNEYVLTAAHCMFSYKPQDLEHLSLHIGDHNIRSSNDGNHETRKIAKIILHKGFNIQNYYNDIALLKLDNPVNYTRGRIHPICLPEPELNVGNVEGKQVTAMGWGLDRPWGRPADVLKYVEMPMWKFNECKRIYNTFAPNRLQTWNICAGDWRRNKDACIGDSGGPLVYLVGSTWTQLGIVSWGKGCGSFPGVYTSTHSFLQWIDKHLKDMKIN